MKRMLILALLTALVGGCVVVPLHNNYDGYERRAPRFEEYHYYDRGDYHYDGGIRSADHGG